jgi:hypothetical protein
MYSHRTSKLDCGEKVLHLSLAVWLIVPDVPGIRVCLERFPYKNRGLSMNSGKSYFLSICGNIHIVQWNKTIE